MNKFFLFKNFKIIVIMFFVFFYQILFPVTFKYNTGENLVQKIRDEEKQEKLIKSVLDAIRGHNNKFVRFYLATKDNINNREKIKEQFANRKEGVYGVNLDEALLFQGNGELVDVNAKTKDGYTPIIVAIEAKNNEIFEAVEILLKKDARLANVGSNVDGWTPLQDATLKANSRIVKMLLEYGANPTITDKHGGTPMDMATKFGKGEIVKMLRDYIKANRGRL